MKQLLFPDDTQFWFETLRLFSNASYGGSDFGEVLAAASQITDGDYDSWHDAYRAQADRLRAEATGARPVTQRDLLLRASTYYFTAGFFLHANPTDPRVTGTYDLSRECFHRAAELFSPAVELVEIPYDGTLLYGYFYRASGEGRRPTLIMHSGLDGGAEELHYQGAATGPERGYHVLTFDGPGQPSAIRLHHLVFRPDWEHVVGAVLDHLETDPGVNQDRIALLGMSFGGYLAPRAAAFEPRLAAVAACDGIYDAAAAFTEALPWDRAEIQRRATAEHDEDLDHALAAMATNSPTAKWTFAHGRYVLGASTDREFLARLLDYALDGGVAEQITCPVLICEAANDHFFKNNQHSEARRLYEHLTSPKTLITFTAEEGSDEHCQVGAQRLLLGRIYDWLDATMTTGRARGDC
jgi:alpha-beta hydrolase superfamily lysophospholipase